MTARKSETKVLQMAKNTLQFWWHWARHTVVPFVLTFTMPFLVILLFLLPLESGISSFNIGMLLGNRVSWTWTSVIMAWAILSLQLPSKTFYGPPDEFDFRPQYSANGLTFYFMSLIAFIVVNSWRPSISSSIYDNMPQILCNLEIVALLLCFYLWWKGTHQSQIGKRKVVDNFPVIFQFFRGMEVHPRIWGMDVKQLTNCRIGLMMWQILILAFMFTSFQRTGFNSGILVNVVLQSTYLAKFYNWETGYFNTLDITLDRAGYYICWGCLVFVPSIYTFSTYYFVSHPPATNDTINALIFVLGILFIYLNYDIDHQKETFKAGGGKCKVWGKTAVSIPASYKTSSGVKKTQLLVSGYWGVARHLNYVTELLLALLWNLPGWNLGIVPFLYNGYLTFLLVHRIYRDEEKCQVKYGKAWQEYCKKVPFRLIPGIY